MLLCFEVKSQRCQFGTFWRLVKSYGDWQDFEVVT